MGNSKSYYGLEKVCRRGVPAELRARVWAASLGVKISVVSSSKMKWLASLRRVSQQDAD